MEHRAELVFETRSGPDRQKSGYRGCGSVRRSGETEECYEIRYQEESEEGNKQVFFRLSGKGLLYRTEGLLESQLFFPAEGRGEGSYRLPFGTLSFVTETRAFHWLREEGEMVLRLSYGLWPAEEDFGQTDMGGELYLWLRKEA